MDDLDSLYLPSVFVKQRVDFCSLYFPEQLARYDAARKQWFALNSKNEPGFQKALRDLACEHNPQCKDAEGAVISEDKSKELLEMRAQKSLKKDMLSLAKADEKKAEDLCKETLELLEGDTLDLTELTAVFQKDRR